MHSEPPESTRHVAPSAPESSRVAPGYKKPTNPHGVKRHGRPRQYCCRCKDRFPMDELTMLDTDTTSGPHCWMCVKWATGEWPEGLRNLSEKPFRTSC
jgi:hypothetical protein